MLINNLRSFNTVSSGSRDALLNAMLVINGGWGYERVSRDIKTALDSYRLSNGTDSENAIEGSTYRDTTEYNNMLGDIMRASIKSYIAVASKLSAKKYQKQVVCVLGWLAHTNYWYLLGDETHDDDGNYVGLFYPLEYESLATDLYNLVYNKDRKSLTEMLDKSNELGYTNFSSALEELGTEVFYLGSTRNSRDQWKIIMNRFPSIAKDCDQFGAGPYNLYKKYYESILGVSVADYQEIADVCEEKFPGVVNKNILSKTANSSILPFMTKIAQTDEEVRALKSMLIYEA